jgi:hypothetical protein
MARLGRSQPTNVLYSDNITSLPIVTTGTGTAAATGTSLLIAISPVGQGNAAASSPTVALNLVARVDGNGAATSGGTGLLIETARLVGTGAASAGVRPPLGITGGHIDLSGHGDAAAGGRGDLPLTLPITGHGDSTTGGSVPLVVGPPIFGYLAWYDATDLSTIITSTGSSVVQWNDKSGNGYNVTQPTGFKQPSTGLRTICHQNTISFDDLSGRGLTGVGLTLHDSVITVFVAAQATGGNRLLALTDGVQSDWDNTAGLSVIDLADGGSYYNGTQVTGADAGFGTIAFVYDILRDGGFWAANIDGVALPGNLTVDTNFNATDIGIGGIPFPPDVAATATGLVGEILIYDQALSPDQVTAVESYLITKWLLRGASLLAGHGDASDSATVDLTVVPQHLVFIDGHGDAASADTNQVVLGAYLSGHGDAATSSAIAINTQGIVDLTGQGTASATGTTRVVLAAALAGHGDAATTGVGIQIAQLIGHGDNSNTGTFDLIVRPQVDLTGHGDAAVMGTAALRLTAALAGTGTAASAVTSLVVLTLALTGRGAAAASATTTLFGAVQDPDAFTLTIRDSGHMDTIWDRGHTDTLVDSQ